MKSPDAIVIGAGIVGASCALSLTNAGLNVLVIDRGSVSSGTTGAGEGNILVSDKEPGPELTLALRSRDLWFEMQEDVGDSFELEAKGGVVVARSDDSQLMALARSMTISRIGGGRTPADSRKLMKPIDSLPRCSCSCTE